jgi:hypothetical protein
LFLEENTQIKMDLYFTFASTIVIKNSTMNPTKGISEDDLTFIQSLKRGTNHLLAIGISVPTFSIAQ